MNSYNKRVHFVGIGGTGMSGIASILLDLGYKISGSDIRSTLVTQRLIAKGAMIFQGHDSRYVAGADLVVVSSAINEQNKEVIAARKNHIEVIPRAEMLSRIMQQKHRIAVSGTHGKTTTTSMISLILERMHLDPTIAIGGEVNDIGGNAKLGKGDYMVVEADESDGSFLLLNPNLAIVTNIENDHLDYFDNLDKTIESFQTFMEKVPQEGCIVAGYDCKNVRKVLENIRVKKRIICFGFHEQADIRATHVKLNKNNSTSEIYFRGEKLGMLALQVPGYHNILNALAAISIALELNIPFQDIKEILALFKGVKRRQEIVAGFNGNILIIDDYGHHPSEIKATLNAIRQGWPNRRIITVFQPHRYSRTKLLYDQLGNAFHDSDLVIINDIYPANEKPIPGISSDLIYQRIKRYKNNQVRYLANKDETVAHLIDLIKDDDIVLTMGAGDVWQIGKNLAKKIEEREIKASLKI